MGIVYRAMHPGLQVPVAIKVLSEQYSGDPAFRRRFQREATAIAALNHPAIVRVYDFDEDQGALFIVMEYVEGRSLRTWLQHGGRFTVAAAMDVIKQVLSGVGTAHARGVVHRDLKPENLLLTDDGRVKVLDFGIAAMLETDSLTTQTRTIAGTPSYMSPEQGRGTEVDKRSDIYAIGIILYELLHGRPPFVGSVQSVLRSQMYDEVQASEAIPRPLMDVIWKAMAKSPADRYTTCEDFAAALAARAQLGALPETTPDIVRYQLGSNGTKLRVIDPTPTPPPLVTGRAEHSGHCRASGCNRTQGWQCSYVDQANAACDTWWCKDHVEFVDGSPFCRRHASVIRAVLPTVGTIHEIKHLPAVNDRSLSLAALVCKLVDKDLVELLRRHFGSRAGLSVVADVNVRQSWMGRRGEIGWERSWSVMNETGYVTRITIRVTAAKPAVVQVTDNRQLLEMVPDWIMNRLEGRPTDAKDRDRFKSRLLGATEELVREAVRSLPKTSPLKVKQKASR